MNTLFDSGWVPVASGTVQAAVRTEDCLQARIVIAASGNAGAGTTTAGWSVGSQTPIPWTKNTPAYPVLPLITGTYTVAAPGANAQLFYNIGVNISGAVNLAPVVPSQVYVSTVAGAASWVRVIVEGL
jgi:hypothetical protein